MQMKRVTKFNKEMKHMATKLAMAMAPCLVVRKVVIVCIEAWWETMTMVVVLVLAANPMVEAIIRGETGSKLCITGFASYAL
jgi:hypothetical protein